MVLTLFETSSILLLLFIFLKFLIHYLSIPQKLKENEFVSKDLEQLQSNNNDDDLSTLDKFEL